MGGASRCRYAEPAAAGATRRRPRRGTPAADISPPGIRTDVAKTLSVPESGGGRGGRRLPLHSDPALSTCLRASAEIMGSEVRVCEHVWGKVEYHMCPLQQA